MTARMRAARAHDGAAAADRDPAAAAVAAELEGAPERAADGVERDEAAA